MAGTGQEEQYVAGCIQLADMPSNEVELASRRSHCEAISRQKVIVALDQSQSLSTLTTARRIATDCMLSVLRGAGNDTSRDMKIH